MTHDLVCCSEHYSVLRQCKCPDTKQPTFVDCPYPDDPERCLKLALYWNGVTEHVVRRIESPYVPKTVEVANSVFDDGLITLHQGKTAIIVTVEQAERLAVDLQRTIEEVATVESAPVTEATT